VFENGKPNTKECNCNDQYWECDEEIYIALKMLWDKGYDTMYSCAGHSCCYYGGSEINLVMPTVDLNPYIVINGSNVDVKDLEKYKYGMAYINKEAPYHATLAQMKQYGISIPNNYVPNINDSYFMQFSQLSGIPLKEIISAVESGTYADAVLTYTIRTTPLDYDLGNDANKFKLLLEARSDIIKLIELMPFNYIGS
jgi:hypothetical protein